MKAELSPPALIATLSRLAGGFSGIERRKMFGYPALFINGNMFAGLVRDTLVIPEPKNCS